MELRNPQAIEPSVAAAARRMPFAVLVVADAVSMTGNQLAQIAIPWFVLVTTGSAAKTGLAAFAELLPMILSALFGGVVVDRLGHKPASVVADLASLLAVGLIPLLHSHGLLSFPLLLALVFLGALLDAPGTTARAALLPDTADSARLRLEQANAIHEVVESGSQLAGPLLAGVLIAWLGAGRVLWLDAGSFGLSAALVAGWVAGDHAESAAERGRYLAELAEGLRFVFSDPPIRSIFLSATVISFVFSPLLAVVLPYYMKTVLNSSADLGFVVSAFGGGAVAGAVVYGLWGHAWPRRLTFVVGVFAIGGGFVTLALLPPVWVMVVGMLLAGLIAGPNGPLISTVLQERTPPALRGRVFGATTALGYAAAPLGVLVAGALLPILGTQVILIAIAAIHLSVALTLALDLGLRRMNEPVIRTG